MPRLAARLGLLIPGVVSALTLIVAVQDAAAQQGPPRDPGPPPFLTRPILLHVNESALEHGHFVFGGEAATPAPLAPQLGTAAYSPVQTAAALSLAMGLEVNVSNSPNSYEGETGGFSGAANGSVLVAASNHLFPGSCRAFAASGTFGDCAPLAYRSMNGTAWSKTALPRLWNGTLFGIGFDPSVDVDKSGVFYASYGVAPLSSSFPNGIVVVKSTDGTVWTKATPVTFNRRTVFDDKYYLAVDRSNTSTANRIYVSWDRNTANNQILYIASSSNGGATWSAPVKVNDGTSGFERVIGAYPAVDHRNGIVYDSWHDYAKNKIFVDSSTTGGSTWSRDVAAAVTHAGFGADIGCVGGRSQGPAHALKVGPSGTVYLVYADPVASRGFDILFTKSTNGGASWDAPRTLNDDSGPAHQFHSTLSVESNGQGGDRVTVSFYDRRDDPANCMSHVYATQSADSGATWSSNVRQTSAASNFDGNTNGPGDYSSSAPFASAVWPFFSDHRSTNPETAPGGAYDVYTVKVQPAVCAAAIDVPGQDICNAAFPDDFVPFSAVFAGFGADCAGTEPSVGIGYSSFPYVVFKSGAVDMKVGDPVQVRYTGWAGGSTGAIVVKASISPDGTAWTQCGTAQGRDFLQNSSADLITCAAPFAANGLFVRLETTTLSPAIILLRQVEVKLPATCGGGL